ncbi:hypothetical protein IMY05_004G0015300 [Salix suchowensis]|nr:hypothetical protein IMY05_004G0015300 [Salix suchowensis]
MLTSFSMTIPLPREPAYFVQSRPVSSLPIKELDLINPEVHQFHFQTMRLQSLNYILGRVCGWKARR